MPKQRMWMTCGLTLLIFAGLCVGFSIGQGQSQPTPNPETLLPASAVVYVGWDGNEAHEKSWKQTAAYESLHKTGLADLIKKAFVIILRQTGSSETDVLKILDQISQKGVSLAVSLPDAAGPPLPRAVVVLHKAGELEPLLAGFLKKSVENQIQFKTTTIGKRKVTRALVPNSPGVEVGWWTEGEHLVMTVGINAVNSTIQVADGKSPNITTNSLWKTYREQKKDYELATMAWFDFGTLRRTFGSFPLPAAPAVGPLTVSDLLKPLGLDQTGALVYRSGYQKRAMVSQTILESPAPRTGLLALAEQEPISLNDLPPLPANSRGFYARSLDLSKCYDLLLNTTAEVFKLGPPELSDQYDAMSQQLPFILGFDPGKELLEPLGNVMCFFGDSQHGVFGIGGGLALEVDDPQTLRKTTEKLLAILAGSFGETVQIQSVQKHDREMFVIEFPQFPLGPALAIDDNWFIVGLSSQTVEAFLLRLDNKLPHWEPTPEYQQALAVVPQEFTSLAVTDPRETIRSLLSFTPMALAGLQAGMAQNARFTGKAPPNINIKSSDIPPAELVTSPLFPNVSVGTVDAVGLHWNSRTSLPSIPLFAGLGGSNVAVPATLVALLLPAVQQARMAARRAQSKNNLKQFGLALHNYHDVHSSFPAGTHPNKDLKPEQRLSWIADVLPFLDQAPLFNAIDFDKAWDDKTNKTITSTKVPLMFNPSIVSTNQASTHYVGLAGLGKDGPTLPVTHKRAGFFGYNRVTRLRDITDGSSNTAAVSEASKDFGPWARGGKSTIRPLTKKPYINGPDGIGSPFPGGCHVLFADGSVRFISENIDPQTMERLTTIRDGNPIPRF